MRLMENDIDKTKRIKSLMIYIFAIVLMVAVLTLSFTNDRLFVLSLGAVDIHFDNMLVILVTGIVGFVAAMFGFFVFFVTAVILEVGRAYTVFVYLLASVLAVCAVNGRWYKKERVHLKLMLLVVVLAFLIGDVQMILKGLADGQGFSDVTPLNTIICFVGELPECIVSVCITYCYLIKLPDEIKELTQSGSMYVESSNNHTDVFDQLKESRLSRKVSAIIILEGLVLGIAAAGFVNVLLPTMGADALSYETGNILEDVLSDEEAVENTLEDVQSDYLDSKNGSSSDSDEREHERHMRFVMNRHGLAFDLKLFMMLLNVAIPYTVLSNVIAQWVIVSPIRKMSSSIGDFCEVGQEEKESRLERIQSLNIRNKDEIGVLYHELNQMATSITSFVDEEREKEKLAAELVIAKKTSENKSNFLSSMSHELRTPINAVLGLDEMIIRESRNDEITGYAIDIQNAGKSLLGLVNDILDSSKLEAGKMELIPTEYELASLINDLINMISVKAEDKGLNLDINIDEGTPHILYGDEIRLKQIILNILTNAVKYTEDGTVSMNIGFKKINDEYINLDVEVKDTGIGIKEEDIKKLFSRFERIEESRNKNIEGTGLGMSIVKQLLRMMDSELEVESVYGEGSSFRFSVKQKVVRWIPIGNFSEMYKQTVSGNQKYHVGFTAPDARILIVDDTVLNLTVAKGLLKDTRIRIDTAESGPETLELVQEHYYDIIFLDQRMPDMDGIETFHELQKLSETGRNRSDGSPVIALTANAVSGSREQFLKEGFTDYLSKPIDSSKLEEMVREYLPEALIKAAPIIIEETDDDYSESAGHTDSSNSPLKGITAIDYDVAINNCGSEGMLMNVLKDYLEAIPSKSSDIQSFLDEKDYRNYTVLVHALKSSSRLIGATALSEEAAYLENCGDKAEVGDAASIREIAERTPGLLKLYRSYYDKLMPLVSNEEDEDLRPEIDQDSLDEAIYAIREFAEAFDFDSADEVMKMLADYRMPADKSDIISEIKRKLSDVDRKALLDALERYN